MDARDTIRAILDADQGVCPDGHDCTLIWRSDGTPARTCGHDGSITTHDQESLYPVPILTYVGWPLIADGVTPEQIEAVRAIDPDLAEWAEASIADR